MDVVGAGPHPLIRFAGLGGAVLLAGCTTTGTPAPATGPDPLAFFRALEEGCRQHAAQLGVTAVEDGRFREAKVVRDRGDGATEIEDGRGTRLVVVPGRGIALPASGSPTDVMPPPYGFTCSEEVFVGAAAD